MLLSCVPEVTLSAKRTTEMHDGIWEQNMSVNECLSSPFSHKVRRLFTQVFETRCFVFAVHVPPVLAICVSFFLAHPPPNIQSFPEEPTWLKHPQKRDKTGPRQKVHHHQEKKHIFSKTSGPFLSSSGRSRPIPSTPIGPCMSWQ